MPVHLSSAIAPMPHHTWGLSFLCSSQGERQQKHKSVSVRRDQMQYSHQRLLLLFSILVLVICETYNVQSEYYAVKVFVHV